MERDYGALGKLEEAMTRRELDNRTIVKERMDEKDCTEGQCQQQNLQKQCKTRRKK